MTTQYTPVLKLALPVTGELSGTWGDVVNDNITSMIEQAIAGLATINTWTGNSHTLTTANGTTSESRCAMLVLTDTGVALTGPAEVVCPTAAKIYIVRNTCGQTATIKTSGGSGIAIPNGETSFVFCDGTNVIQAVTRLENADIDFNLLKGTGAVFVTNILDEDNMASDSATALATQQSIKAYVDAQIAANNDLSEVLANGNTTGGHDIAVSAGDDITFTDTSKAIFGAGSDLQVYHDGTNSYVSDQGTGALKILASSVEVKNAADTETMLTATTDGAVALYYDNSTKLATTTSGVDITGGVNATGNARIGVQNTDATLTTYGTGNLNLSTNEGTNSGTIQIAQGVNGNITLTPNGTGYVSVPNVLVSGGTANGVLYLNGSKVATSGSALTFDGAQLGVNGITVGRGAGAVASNTAVGASALAANTSGDSNTAIGYQALDANTTGTNNVAVGLSALTSNTTASNNTAVGHSALELNTTGTGLVAMGLQALEANTTGNYNTSIGFRSLTANTTASNNTAVGYQAVYSNVTGGYHTAVGYKALYSPAVTAGNFVVGKTYTIVSVGTTSFTSIGAASNTVGVTFTATGAGTGTGTATGKGDENTSLGYQAGYNVNVGYGNTLVGATAGYSLTTGSKNTFVGASRLTDGSGFLMTTGSANTIIGGFDGNQGGLDIRTSNNYIVLSDGDGNPRVIVNSSGIASVGAGIQSTRINPRVSSTTSTASITPDVASYDQYCVTAQAVGLTINAPTGTPVDGNKLIFRILDNGGSQTLTWNATFTAIGVTIPTATTAGKMTYVGTIYNAADTRWDVVAVVTQA